MEIDEKIDDGQQQQRISPKNPLRNHTNNNQQQQPLPQPGEPPQQQPEMDSQNAAEQPKKMMQQEDEDRYKPEGQILFKIEKMTEFVRSPNETRRLSEPAFVRGLPWRILVIVRDSGMGRRGQYAARFLSYFLQCNADNPDPGWSCAGTAKLKVLSQKEGKEDHARQITHIYDAKANDWGFSNFLSFEALLAPENGLYDEQSDTIILAADITADAPHGLNWDSKKDTGCIGLKNQGATCYMNSILQTLFFTNKLRKAVYQMPTEQDNPETSVALAMQRVFYELQFSESPVGTKKLTKSFGWDSVDSFLQNDVQEFCRVLLDNLEDKMKNTKVADTIPSLFKGRMKSYIKCKDVDFESSHEECFYDVQLNVKNKTNVLESFKDYIEPEILDGDNKYDAGHYGLQPAEKGLKFLSFPPVLHLQLMRFQYDPQLDQNIKINEKYEFPEVLELDQFVERDGKEVGKEANEGEFTYFLHAVLVHAGDFGGGHYMAFINTNLGGNPKWCKFDDDVVSRVASRLAIEANFGGNNNAEVPRKQTSAYMLVYIRKNAIDEALCPVLEEDIPEHLKIRFEKEKKTEEIEKTEREEANNYCLLTVITDEEMKPHHGFELVDPTIIDDNYPKRFKVLKSLTYEQMFKYVAAKLELGDTPIRIWEFSDHEEGEERLNNYFYDNKNPLRPRIELDPNSTQRLNDNSLLFNENLDRLLYVEVVKNNGANMNNNSAGNATEQQQQPLNVADDVEVSPSPSFLVFVKYYNAEAKQLEYKGSTHLDKQLSINQHLPMLNKMVGLPEDTPINLYTEFLPDTINPVKLDDQKIIEYSHGRKFHNGLILVVERAPIDVDDSMGDNAQQQAPDVKKHYYTLYNQIEVEAHVNVNGLGPSKLNQPAPPIKGAIALNWNIPRLCSWLANELDYDFERILPWKVASEKPFIYLSADQYKQFTVKDLLSINQFNTYDPRQKRVFKLFYTKLPFRVMELEERKHLQVQMLSDDFQITEITLFPRKHGNVRDVLEEAKNEFTFTPNGTGILRLVYVYSNANCSRVFQVLKEDSSYNDIIERSPSSAFTFRVEEVPKDQLEIGPDEHLFPIAHFDKEPTRMFGVPFFVKVSNRDTVAEIKQRIRQMLRVPEKEFEKYKFHIVVNNKCVRNLDEDETCTIENLTELLDLNGEKPFSSEPYIGIDHLNKMRGSRGGMVEKPIIIHN